MTPKTNCNPANESALAVELDHTDTREQLRSVLSPMLAEHWKHVEQGLQPDCPFCRGDIT